LGRNTSGLIRITGYSDLAGNNTETIKSRKEALIKLANDYFGSNLYDEKVADHWVGIRPVAADDVPIIGKSTKFNNLFWNTGHGGRGVTFSLGSGKILSHIIENYDEQTQNEAMKDLILKLNLENYSPSRFEM
jgi:D-amino-acid dehydrogenase